MGDEEFEMREGLPEPDQDQLLQTIEPIHQDEDEQDNKWTIFFLLILSYVSHNFIPPYIRPIPQNMPLLPQNPSTIPFYVLIIIFFLLLVVIILRSCKTLIKVLKSTHPTNFIASILVTNILTDITKSAVGRLRPDFMARCILVNETCTGSLDAIRQGRLSFPSGHSSTAWCIAVYFALWWYLNGVGSRLQRVCLGFALLLLAALVGVTRLLDNKHHVDDVIGGSLLGSSISLALYYFC